MEILILRSTVGSTRVEITGDIRLIVVNTRERETHENSTKLSDLKSTIRKPSLIFCAHSGELTNYLRLIYCGLTISLSNNHYTCWKKLTRRGATVPTYEFEDDFFPPSHFLWLLLVENRTSSSSSSASIVTIGVTIPQEECLRSSCPAGTAGLLDAYLCKNHHRYTLQSFSSVY